MKTFLVTGGMGFIGSHTVVELINQYSNKEEIKIIIVDNLSNSNMSVLGNIKKIVDLKNKEDVSIEFFNVDILDKEKLTNIFKINKIDSVIHFAGYKAVGESVEKPLLYYKNNVGGTVVLLEVMQEFGVKDIIFSSSATVYGANNISPLDENLPLSTTNPYGATKLMIENILQDLSQTGGWNIILLRYFNPVGSHISGLIGENPKGVPNNLMPYINQVAVNERECLSIFGNDYDTIDGTGVRDYIHVVDLARGHVKALDYIYDQSDKNKDVFEAINLGTGNGISVLEMVKMYEKINGVKVNYKIVDRRAGDADICFADSSKAHQILGWKSEFTLEDMCRDSYNFIQNLKKEK